MNDRELLECTGCDLVEDVAFDGSLMTYHRDSDDMTDSGLRFEEMDEGKYRCPVCGTVSKAQFLGLDNPHPFSQMQTELIWEGKYDEYGNRRTVDIAGCAIAPSKD